MSITIRTFPLRSSVSTVPWPPGWTARLMGWAIALCALSVPPTLLLLAVDGRVLEGEALWLKPLKFQISMVVHGATVLWAAWLFGRRGAPHRAVGWAVAAVAVAMLYELVFLNLQAARGVASHFNDATPFDAIGGSIMAAMAGVLVTGPAVIGLASIARGARSVGRDPLPVAAGLGLILGGVMAAYSGSALGANGGPFVGGHDPLAPVWPLMGWSTTGGDLRVGHFVGLHLMQALPLWAVAVARLAGPARAAWSLLPVAALGVWASWAATQQALAGVPLL
ncbi:MAG: hypothetical protein ACU0CO_07645 [Shimia sp.]